jgi:DNA-binding response OmpR family regulator
MTLSWALSNMRPDFYNILLLDINMPLMNGFELYDKIKKIDSQVKVCFTSAFDVNYNTLREKFPSLNIEYLIQKDIIRKPIEISELIKRIELELLT